MDTTDTQLIDLAPLLVCERCTKNGPLPEIKGVTMSLPPGVENINYRQYRLEVRHQGPGWKILIYPPGSEFGLSEVPNTNANDEREAVIAQAKKTVDADIKKKRNTPTGSYVPK